VSFALVVAAVVAAGPAAPAAGTYDTEGAWGHLELKKGRFKIDALGGNAHTCGLEGVWKGATGFTDGDDVKCELKFVAKPEGAVEIVPVTEDACRNYCGVRATFDGTYFPPLPGCTSAEVKKVRASFKTQFDAKKYAEALATLEPMFSKCEKRLDRFDQQWVRNDLAITAHHAGDDAQCLKWLEPLGELRDPADADEAYGEPAFEEIMKKIAKATRTNAQRCGYKKK